MGGGATTGAHIVAPTEDRASTDATPGGAYRADIQGLRAIAVLLVIAFHSGMSEFSGGFVGVDVFFVISGFLITGLLLREVERSGRIDLPRFWARRIRRLLPAASLVLVAVAVLTMVVLPVTRWATIAGDILSSAFYLLNWRLAERSVDYLAADEPASPVQHFWSLAVEEQFYVFWPVLIIVLVWGATRIARSRAPERRPQIIGASLAVVAAASLGWSVHLTGVDSGRAFFVTTTRLWELALGGIIAVSVPLLARLGRWPRLILGWAGLGAIGYSAVQFTATTPFPGVAALIPTLGAAALLIAGIARSDDGAARVLGVAPLERVGEMSYSLYLWHWPLLVFATYLWAGGSGVLSVPVALAVVTFSVAPAWLAYRLVERPLHHWAVLAVRPARAFAVAAVCSAAVVAAVVGIQWSLAGYSAAQDESAMQAAPPPSPAPVPSAEPTDSGEPAEPDPDDVWLTANLEFAETMTPDPIDAAEDNPEVHKDGCYQNQRRTDVVTCVYGDPDSDVVVALVGDSHAAHWQPALSVVAESQGWRLETYIKSACFFGDADVWLRRLDQEYTACAQWNDAALERLLSDPPDLVVSATSGEYDAVVDGSRIDDARESDAILVDGLAARWATLLDAGSQVVVIADTPWRDTDVPECVAETRPEVAPCNVDRQWGVERSAVLLQQAALRQEPRAEFVDLTDSICTDEVCPAVISGVLVMRDTHHMTATFARTLGPRLEVAMLEELGDDLASGP